MIRWALQTRLHYVMVTYVDEVRNSPESNELAALRRRLIEAEQEYRRARADGYVVRLIRDSAIVDAHRGGMSSREISDLVGDIGQPNVVRARRRAITLREVVPGGMLSPADALRVSGLEPAEFIGAVRDGQITSVEVGAGVRAFRPEDVEALAVSLSNR
jgi:hypothetical protein